MSPAAQLLEERIVRNKGLVCKDRGRRDFVGMPALAHPRAYTIMFPRFFNNCIARISKNESKSDLRNGARSL